MKKVYVCAPSGGDVLRNAKRAARYTQYALKCGTAPVTPHFYGICLDSADPRSRELCKRAGRSMLWLCDEIWVFGDVVTRSMKEELDFCRHLNIRVRRISENEIEKKLGGINEEKGSVLASLLAYSVPLARSIPLSN